MLDQAMSPDANADTTVPEAVEGWTRSPQMACCRALSDRGANDSDSSRPTVGTLPPRM
jgi:hypothetical protein